MKAPARKSGLSKHSYGGCSGADYVPYVSPTEVMPEITGYSIIMGILFALLFGAANTYLGLKVGLTIASAVPGAILAIGLLRKVFKRNNILEANVVSSLAAMGEAISGGVIFVLPALILLGFGLSITTIVIVTLIGGLMGVAFISPVRRYLIVEEHGTLIYPEGMAAAAILVTGTEGAGGFKTIIMGISVGAAFKLLAGGFSVWSEEAAYSIKSYQGTIISFFFAVVSGRMVGMIGESNNPVSGMTIASLLIVATVMKLMGNTGTHGMTAALMVGSVICMAISVAGGTSQSLKTTFIIGGDPRANQVGMFVALSVASVAAAGTLMMLNKAYGVGSMAIPAPQATLMKMIVQGIMTAQLPWTLVAIGVALAIFCYLVDLPVLAVAIGIYLPLGLTSAVFAGGLIRSLVERASRRDGVVDDTAVDKGVLLASGMVAGDALIGIVIGLFAAIGFRIGFGQVLFPAIAKSSLLSLAMFLLLAGWMFWYSRSKDKAL